MIARQYQNNRQWASVTTPIRTTGRTSRGARRVLCAVIASTVVGLLGTPADAQVPPGQPDFIEWNKPSSGSYFNNDVVDPASNWISHNYLPFPIGTDPQPPGLMPSQIDTIYFDGLCEPGTIGGLACGTPTTINMADGADTSPVFVGNVDVGSGDWIFNFADRKFDVNGIGDDEFQEPGELSVGTTSEISARLTLYPGDSPTDTGLMETDNGYLGLDPRSSGTVVVDFGTQWINVERQATPTSPGVPGSGHMGIGYSGFGLLDIHDGGYVLTRQAMVGGGIDDQGGFEEGFGEVYIDAGEFLGTSRWDVQETLWVGGFTGTALVSVQANGHLAVGGDTLITGDGPPDSIFDDPGRLLEVQTGGSAYVGDRISIVDHGALHIEGGFVETHNLDFSARPAAGFDDPGRFRLYHGTIDIMQGTYKGSDDQLRIDSISDDLTAHMIFSDGASNVDSFDSGIIVGDQSNATLTIRGGPNNGTSVVTGSDLDVVTTTAESSGTVYTQDGSVLALSGDLRVSGSFNPASPLLGGQGGQGFVSIQTDSLVSVGDDVYIGYTVEPVTDPGDPDFPNRYIPSGIAANTGGSLVVADHLDNHGGLFINSGGTVDADTVFNRGEIEFHTNGTLSLFTELVNSNDSENDAFNGLIRFHGGGLAGTISSTPSDPLNDSLSHDVQVHNFSGSTIEMIEGSKAVFTANVSHYAGATFFVSPGSEARFEGELNASGHFNGFGLHTIAGTFSRIDGSPFDRTFFSYNLTVEDTAVIRLGLAGTNDSVGEPGETPQYDWLDVRFGDVILAGTLEVSLFDGFVPEIGDEFFLVEAINVTGEFDNLNLPDLGSTVEWDLDYLTDFYELDGVLIDSVRLTLREAQTPIPEPATLSLLALGLAAIRPRASRRCSRR